MIAKLKSRRVRRNAPLSATERRSLKSILRKHRSNPGTRAKTKLWGNSSIPGGRLGDVARELVDPSRYAFKPHGKWDYVLVKFASADALRREIEEDGARCPAYMGGGSRGMGKAAVGWKPATLWLRDGARSNPARSNPGKIYRLADGSVLTATQYKRIWPGGKCPSPAQRRLLGITVSTSRSNPTAAGRRAKSRTAAGYRAASWYAATSGRSNDRAMDRMWHLSHIAQKAGGLNKFASSRKAGASRGRVIRCKRR